jgi:hypothetical protein
MGRIFKEDCYMLFNDPVDPKEYPEYYEAIKHPMCWETMKKVRGVKAPLRAPKRPVGTCPV